MLEALDLVCERGGRTLFRGLSLALKRGELLRIAGANGSGKTSLLRILCGLLTPTAGEVRWHGSAIRSLREDYARQLLYLGHAPAVKDELSAAENLSIACTLSGNSAPREALHHALRQFGVPDGAVPVGKLSQGQRKRAALARLLVPGSASLWLLDEPFSALDADGARFLEEVVSRHAADGGAVAFTTHQDYSGPVSLTVHLHA